MSGYVGREIFNYFQSGVFIRAVVGNCVNHAAHASGGNRTLGVAAKHRKNVPVEGAALPVVFGLPRTYRAVIEQRFARGEQGFSRRNGARGRKYALFVKVLYELNSAHEVIGIDISYRAAVVGEIVGVVGINRAFDVVPRKNVFVGAKNGFKLFAKLFEITESHRLGGA